MQKHKGVGGFLNKKEGGQGALGIFALLSFLPTAEQGREEWLGGGGPGRRLRARGRLWGEGKERGRGKDPIPGRGLGRGGLRRPDHEGGGGERRRPWWRRCGARWRPRSRGKEEGR